MSQQIDFQLTYSFISGIQQVGILDDLGAPCILFFSQCLLGSENYLFLAAHELDHARRFFFGGNLEQFGHIPIKPADDILIDGLWKMDGFTIGLAEAERAFSQNPKSLIMMPHLGYLLILLGDWERGPELIRRAIEFNPYYDVIVHHALWLDWIRRGDAEKAHAETLHFRTPLLFWDPLLKAATLGLLGRIDEGKREIQNLLKLNPDFTNRGRVLIKHHNKFDDIFDRMLRGLNKVGLSIKEGSRNAKKFRMFSIYFKDFYKQMLLLSKDFSAFLATSSTYSCAKYPLQRLRFESSFQGIYYSPKFRRLKPTRQRGFIL